MNKKVLVILMVLVLVVTGLSAKDLGIKVGGQLGWGFDIGRMTRENSDDGNMIIKAINNGFAFNVTGEYAFDQNWSVKANFGMMFAGKAAIVVKEKDEDGSNTSSEKSGLYIDFAVDAKYTYAINDKISVSGLAGLELVSGYLTKDSKYLYASLKDTSGDVDLSPLHNTAFGLNLGVEGSYKITDEISVVGGVTGAWLFVNSSKFVKDVAKSATISGVASFYIRPYVGATYAF